MANIGGPCWRKNGVPYLELPFRVVLSNGFTRTDPSQYSLEPDVMNDIRFESSTLTQNDLDILFPPPPPEPPKTWLELGYTTPEGWKLGWTADDVALLTGLYVLAKRSNELGNEQPCAITDLDGNNHVLTFSEFEALMLSYGAARMAASAGVDT
jgi:hypothetical protein